MTRRLPHLLAVACLAAGMASVATPAGAVPGPGTFTEITTPGGTTSFHFRPGTANQFTVRGRTSPDVTSVDIQCTSQLRGQAPRTLTLALSVPVAANRFTGTATYGPTPASAGSACRLRAVPHGVDPTNPLGYLGAYSGPVLHTDELEHFTGSGSADYAMFAIAGDGEGALTLRDAGQCGINNLTSVPTSTLTPGASTPSCAFMLPPVTAAGDSSGITVSGHNAYLPSGVHDYLIDGQALGVTQPALTTTMKIAANGDVTITESAKLMRCSNGDAFPPTPTSCPSLIDAGVTFERVSTFFRHGHQVRMRDTFTSTDAKSHAVNLDYEMKFQEPNAGELGFAFPGHSSQFRAPALGSKITGLGSRAGTVFVRSDLHASSADALADTRGLTYSKPPSRLRFDGTTAGAFAMRYGLSVPASGRAFIGFADSEGTFTADVKKLASAAVHDMVEQPTITSPHNGATVHGKSTTVQGRVTAGANGLPTHVSVNGHKASVGATSLVHGAWSVTFTEPLGRHTITVTAIDRVGNTASRSIRIRNT